jgi:hypothetical protein
MYTCFKAFDGDGHPSVPQALMNLTELTLS